MNRKNATIGNELSNKCKLGKVLKKRKAIAK